MMNSDNKSSPKPEEVDQNHSREKSSKLYNNRLLDSNIATTEVDYVNAPKLMYVL